MLPMKTKILLAVCFLILCCAFLCACDAYSLSFTEETYYVEAGKSVTPAVSIKPKNNSYVLSVANETVASVSEDGKTVTGLKSGATTTLYVRSGKKTAEATLIVSSVKSPTDMDYSTYKQYTVTFRLANYADVGLDSEIVSVGIYYETDSISENLPYYRGYDVSGWYKDKACTQALDRTGDLVYSNLDLYCKATMLDNPFTFNGLAEVSGLLFDNLPHAMLNFPEETPQGQQVTGIADGAFSGDKLVQTVSIPATYTRIGDFAFAGCKNLKTVNIAEGSVLQSIGQFAFGYTKETETNDEDEETEPTVTAGDVACEKLAEINLPDSVSEIGAFAFYGCESLVLNGIPSSLSVLPYGVFGKTKINNVDFSNVTDISAYAFFDCPDLTILTHTQNVESCEKAAFLNSKFYKKAISTSPYTVYADTILVKCSEPNGKLTLGRVTLPENATLIADGAFNGDNQTEMTVYFGKEGVLIGDDAFRDAVGVCLVVPEESLESYKAENPYYVSHFCTPLIWTEEDPEKVNFGKHTLLKFDDSTYFYDKYERLVVNERLKSASTIDFSKLPNGSRIRRINARAFNLEEKNIRSSLTTMIFSSSIADVAFMAILNCNNLKRIDLTALLSPPNIEADSFQFRTLGTWDPLTGSFKNNGSCLLYVKRDDKDLYMQVWANKGDAQTRVTYDGEYD